MVSYARLMLQFAVTAGIAAMLSTAAPAVAADRVVASEASAVDAKTAPASVERRALRDTVIAASRHRRRADPIRYSRDCSGVWCGRQFVLMLGVAY